MGNSKLSKNQEDAIRYDLKLYFDWNDEVLVYLTVSDDQLMRLYGAHLVDFTKILEQFLRENDLVLLTRDGKRGNRGDCTFEIMDNQRRAEKWAENQTVFQETKTSTAKN